MERDRKFLGVSGAEQEVLNLLRTLLGVEEELMMESKRGARNVRGRRIHKPFGLPLRAAEIPQGPRRDPRGRRIHKPHDPRKNRR